MVVDWYGDYEYFESPSVNRHGVVVGIALEEYDADDPSTSIPAGFVARKSRN